MASYKPSNSSIQKNKDVWTNNLVKFEDSHKRRRMVPLEEYSLEEKCRMPLQKQIIGRYHFLGPKIKGRKERIAEISKEVTKLWKNKLNFPHVSDQVIRAKLDKILKCYDECVKRGSYEPLDEIFDITKVDGTWLSSEDKRLYHLQVESKGTVGYSTGQAASKETIHPSKRQKLSNESSNSSSYYPGFSDSDSEADDSEYENNEEEDETTPTPSRKHHKSKIAVNLVTSTRVSTNKAANICKQLAREGIDIPTPCQSAIYKSTIKEAIKLKEEMIEKLHMESWSLHFDGKHIDRMDYQVVVLKNERREIKLDVLGLVDGRALTIAQGISKVLDEFHLWNSIQMIVADTTSVNTGKKNGVVVILQRMFTEKRINKPQFISCQHHVLDRILRLVMDEELGSKTQSPNIEYPFVSQLLKEYEQLKTQFDNGTEVILETSGWRDDMKFLFHLTQVFRFFEEKGHFPLIRFQKIPNISNARWNSRAILAILVFNLIPSTRTVLQRVCRFISYGWADHWFTDQLYNENDFNNLAEILNPYKKALSSLKNHWKREPSILQIPRSNQCAERAIKVMEEIYSSCKNKDKLHLRFLLCNKQEQGQRSESLLD